MKKTFVFPQIMEDNDEPGMTLRDYFAGEALAGICSQHIDTDLVWNAEGSAMVAYEMADAMLAEREKGKE